MKQLEKSWIVVIVVMVVGAVIAVISLVPTTWTRPGSEAYEAANFSVMMAIADFIKNAEYEYSDEVWSWDSWDMGPEIKRRIMNTGIYHEVSRKSDRKTPLTLYEEPQGALGIVVRMNNLDDHGMVWAVTYKGNLIKIFPEAASLPKPVPTENSIRDEK